jgi:hypothetical protein
MTTTEMAFLGLGGDPDGANLVQAGSASSLESDPHDGFPRGLVLASPREAAERRSRHTMLANDDAVEAVTNGPEGLLAGLVPWGASRHEHNWRQDFPDGWRSSRGRAARTSRHRSSVGLMAKNKGLWIRRRSDLERCRPVLEALGQGIFHMGSRPSRVGQTGNFLLAATIGVGRSPHAGRRGSILAGSTRYSTTLFGSPVVNNYGLSCPRRILAAGFLAHWDSRICSGPGRWTRTGVPLPLAITRHINDSIARGRTMTLRDSPRSFEKLLPEVKR